MTDLRAKHTSLTEFMSHLSENYESREVYDPMYVAEGISWL